jgi:hypothetical protein
MVMALMKVDVEVSLSQDFSISSLDDDGVEILMVEATWLHREDA